jgi:hypothetical protein
VSYLIQNPNAIRLKVNRCRALPSPPRFPKRLGGNTCVQDLSEASLGSLLFVIVSGLSLRASTRARSHGMISRPGYCSTRPLQIARATVRLS